MSTVWYNYTLASAGTIIDENTSSSSPVSNTAKATESVCPKGWTLPGKTQIDSNRNISSFAPVTGGGYSNGTLYYETTLGIWWGSEAYDGANRYRLRYNSSEIYTNNGRRDFGYYVRCVQKSASNS